MFKLIKQEEIKNLEIELFEFEHVETKARHIHLKADDNENGFICNFKTLPNSDNGVMHILEHSVLSGSRDFPLNDPFDTILKNSLQTFLNAMTYPDHTCYPFATQNKKDFFNLMQLYTNFIMFPLLRKETFLQEGWRYEFEDKFNKNSELTLTGVVFNEMIGAMASSSSKLWKNIFKSLYPDTSYAKNSGGDPISIPNLSYEEFCDYHKKHYHPSNATFLTYGDIPYTEIQEKLEDFCLSEFTYQEGVTQENIKQAPFKEPKHLSVNYAYKDDDFDTNHFYLKLWAISDITNVEESFTSEFLSSLLSGDSSSVMLKALEDSKLVISPYSFIEDNGRDIFLGIGGKGVKKEDFKKLDSLILDTLNKIAKDGFKQDDIDRQIHQFELDQKTKSAHGSTYGLNMLLAVNSGENHGVSPETYLKPEIALEQLKENLKKDRFLEDFIQEKVLDNNHAVNLEFLASNQQAAIEDKMLEDIAKNKQKNLTEEEALEIISNSKMLDDMQNEEETATMPEFSIKDIPLDKKLQKLETINYKNTTVYGFKAPTSGLTYLSKQSFLEDVKASDVYYLKLFEIFFANLGFKNYTYEETDVLQNSISAGVRFTFSFMEDRYDNSKIYTKVGIGTRLLDKNIHKIIPLMNDMIKSMRFDEKDRIVSLIKKINSARQSAYFQRGDSAAFDLGKTKLSNIDIIDYNYSSLGFDKFLLPLSKDIDNDETFNNLVDNLKRIQNKVIKAYDSSLLSVICSEDQLMNSIDALFDDSIVSMPAKYPLTFDLDKVTEEVILTEKSSSNFCVMTIPAPYFDHELAGAYKVLAKIISNDFIHQNIRRKGGAYGGWAVYTGSNETFSLRSYRDPNISKTFDVYKNLKEWLNDDSNFTQESIDAGILQSIAQNDSPSLKVYQCSSALSSFLDQVTNDDYDKFRKNILSTDIAKVKRVINELLIPNLDNANFTALVNKSQFIKEGLDLKTFEF